MENEKECIALIIPSLHAGGMERVISELANFFGNLGNLNIHLIILSNKEKFYTIGQNVKIHEPNFVSNGFWGSIKLIFFLRKKIKLISPDCILSFGEMYNSFVLLSLLGLNKRIFVSDRSKPDKNWGFIHNNLRVILYKKAFGIISQTAYAAEFIKSKINHPNVKIIGNPFHTYSNGIILNRKNIILTVGRMIKSKQHSHLLQIFSEIKNNDWELHFVGDGPERQNLETLAKQLNLDNKVKFHGNQKNVSGFYDSAKIFAFTSCSEGFPNVIGEAMSHGLVPISYDFIAGASDLIQNNKNGVLVELNKKEEFGEELFKLMNDETKLNTFSKNAIDSMSKFNIDQIAMKYLNFMLNNEKN
jgi:glycosyltransferase involved in cell wall biosynthesis